MGDVKYDVDGATATFGIKSPSNSFVFTHTKADVALATTPCMPILTTSLFHANFKKLLLKFKK
ncbi:hypothetical protein RHMOL_Rhmol12G0046200 [Rhododendron molle]|uniref:Uncharacterized protein n=1 Tax=Rhododendron molle TaxID=49168 RepID=A0ACC0LE76_RHOML|nr:hypothetical protein RHMOL_Rhmol12G0046200 [Rhododendron molle]